MDAACLDEVTSALHDRELGTQHELLAAGGHYAELFGVQAHGYR